MAIGIAQLPDESAALADAGRILVESLQDTRTDRQFALKKVEAAARRSDSGTGATTTTGEDLLAQALLDAQAANMLFIAAIAANEPHTAASGTTPREAVDQIDVSQLAVRAAMKPDQMRFAAEAKPSESLDAAKNRFRDSAKRAICSITDGTSNTIHSVADKIIKVDAAEVLAAIELLGKSFEFVGQASRFVAAAVERLKSLIERLSGLFELPALAGVKDNVMAIWRKIQARENTRDFLAWLMDSDRIGARVEEICLQDGLQLDRLDESSRDLAGMDDRFRAVASTLSGLAGAVVVAGGLAACFTAAAPWVAPISAAAYVVVIAAAVATAAAYFDKGPLFAGVRGVREIVEGASAA